MYIILKKKNNTSKILIQFIKIKEDKSIKLYNQKINSKLKLLH